VQPEGESNPDGKVGFAPYVWMLCGCFLFAWMGEFANQLRPLCDWRLVALARAGLAFVFALSLAVATRAPLTFTDPPVLWMRSVAGSLSLLCTFYALSLLRTSEVLTLTNTFPIWVALLSWPLLRQRPTLAVWAAAVCGVGGVALIQSGAGSGSGMTALPVTLALVAALTSSVAMLGLNQLKGLHPWAVVTHFSGVATVFVLGAWLVGGAPDLTPLASGWVVVLLVGVGISATLGQMCLTLAFTLGQPSRVSVVGLAQIVFAMGLDLSFGGEMFGAWTLAGIGLVMLPTAWVMTSREG